MSDAAANIPDERIDTRADLGSGDAALWSYWMTQDKIAGKEEERWHKRGRKVVARYRDERGGVQGVHRMNILWSNVQTLIPTLYARTPKPDVQRRWMDQDDTGRLASLLLERATTYSLDNGDFDATLKSVVEDRLLPGRGTARVMYVPHFGDPIETEPDKFEGEEDAPVDVDNEGDEGDQGREVVYEETLVTYVYWEDYREGAARTWKQVPWVRYRAFMSQDELVKRFGAKGKRVNLDISPKGAADNDKEKPPADIYKKAAVHEIWDKLKGEVVWLAPGTPDLILDRKDDPLRLPDFFPSPDPLLATTTTNTRIPVPDYAEYQDQAEELDKLTARIDTLTRALKVSGVYAGAHKQALQQLVDDGTENRLIPVEDWAAWADKGGLSNMIQWMPIKEIADTLIQLYAARDKTKELLYEITGIGDIMRGQTSPNETLGAQQLKANFSTRRIVPQQKAVANFARDLIRLVGAVIAEHFDAKTISMITGYPQLAPVPPVPPMPAPQPVPPSGMMVPGSMGGGPGVPPAMPPPDPAMAAYQQALAAAQQVVQQNQAKQKQFDDAVALIKSDGVRGFRLDIEADSTIAPDEMAEKQARVEFLQQMVPLMGQIGPIAQGNPAMASLMKEVALFAVRGFRVARTLEEAFEKAFDVIGAMPPQPPKNAGKMENPAIEQAKIAADVHDTQMKTQTEQMAISQRAQAAAEQAQVARERAQAEDLHSNADLALRGAELHQRGLLEAARTLKTEASSTRGLV